MSFASAFSTHLEIEASDTTFCSGDSVLLEATNGFRVYEWNTGQRGRIIFVNEGGWYILEAEDSLGHTSKDSIYLYEEECDSCQILGETEQSFCGEDSVVLEAANGYSNYEWNDGDTGRIKWVTESGWYEIEATNANGYTCYDSVYITLDTAKTLNYYTNPNPPVVCKGDPVVIELTSGFKHYWWNTGHRYDRAVIYPQEDKTIVVEAEDSNGCEQRIEIDIEVKDCDSCNLIYQEEIVKCGKDSIALEAENGYTDYEWNDGTLGRLKWAKESGWYSVTAKNANGYWCTDSVYVELNEGRELRAYTNPSPAEICIGDSIVIELSGGFKQYWWSTGHRYDRAVLYPTTDTVIVVEAVDSNGCDARIEIEIEVDSCTASELLIGDIADIYLYPNPATSKVHLELKGLQKELIGGVLEIRDVQARLVLSHRINSASIDLDVSHLPKTMYLIKIGDYYGRLLLMD